MPRYYTRRREIRKLRRGERIDFRRGKGYFIVPAPKPKPLPPPPAPAPPVSLFSGKGLFTTSDADSASRHPCAWLALQMDPEGDEEPIIVGNPARICYWQARPTIDIVGLANQRNIPYIAQAETDPELQVALSLDIHPGIPKALVGNVSAWSQSGFNEAVNQGWDLILEWYWQEQPGYTSPNAGGYPLFRNVCFGTYPAENPAHRGNRVYVPQYRQVWKGPFSCWPSEGMTDFDWAAFDAA